MKDKPKIVLTKDDLNRDDIFTSNLIAVNHLSMTNVTTCRLNFFLHSSFTEEEFKEFAENKDINYQRDKSFELLTPRFKKLGFYELVKTGVFYLINPTQKIVVSLGYNFYSGDKPKKSYFHIDVLYDLFVSNLDTVDIIKKEFVNEDLESDVPMSKFSYILSGPNGLSYKTIDMNENAEIEEDLNYNLNYKIEEIKNKLDTTSGFYLFSGDPGTGKTTLLQHLSLLIPDKKFFIMPNSLLHKIGDPNFINFALSYLKDTILVLEDSESLLVTRSINKSLDITSSLLNLTDGILSRMLNLKIICTINTVENIDTALIRKGRLQMNVIFNPLKEDQAIKLAKKLKKTLPENKNYTLAEIYNSDEDNQADLIKKGNKVGFK